MSKIAKYLQEHMEGEVTDSLEARRYFAADSSILKLQPACIAYPRNEDDVRRICRFSWQLAERSHKLPLTVRGGGSDKSGAAIGPGVIINLTAHMDRILYLNPRKKEVSVEPGLNISKLQQTLYTHGLFVPACPVGSKTATVGGTVGGNAAGEKAFKYGSIGRYIESARAVLASGEVIELKPLTKKELSHKMGLSTHEGEVYRELDALLEEQPELIKEMKDRNSVLTTNAAGYNLADVQKNGEFNLIPLIAGSQGTLAILTEATIRLEPYVPAAFTALVSVGRLSNLAGILPEILKLKPSTCEFITQATVEQVMAISPSYYGDVLERPQSAIHLLVEFDDQRESGQKKAIDNVREIALANGADCRTESEPDEQDSLRRVVESFRLLQVNSDGRVSPLPLLDVAVPPHELVNFLEKAQHAHKLVELPPLMYGHAAAGIVYIRPKLELAQLGDRQKLFKLTDALSRLAINFGGTPAAVGGEGRLHIDKAQQLYGKKLHDIMLEVKKIFDPHNILNPGVKFATSEREAKMLLNNTYFPPRKYE